MERGAEEKTQYMYIVRGPCHVTQTFTHADVHSRRHPMRGSQKEGVAPEGGQLVHAIHGKPKEKCMLTLHKHDWSQCSFGSL